MATATSEPTVTYNGKQISYDRYRYEVARQNQVNLEHVDTLLFNEATTLFGVAQNFDQQAMGGYLRQVVPGLVDKYGNVNATLALKYYEQSRDFWWNTKGKNLGLSQDARRGQMTRYATARTRGALQYTARMPKYDSQALSEPIIGAGMKAFMAQGFGAMRDTSMNAMTRAVASYHRDAILYNAGLDEFVVSVQRVAEPNACAFCALMAFSSERTVQGEPLSVRTGSYAVDFHNNCRCTIETMYEGDSPIRPDYYDQFEEEYLSASEEVGTRSAKPLLAEMRKQSGRA